MVSARSDDEATFGRLNDEIVRVVSLGVPERRIWAEDPDDGYTAVGRTYARLMGSGVALLATQGSAKAFPWKQDPSLSLEDCIVGLQSFLDDLKALTEDELRATSVGMSRALAEQLFVPEWDMYEPALHFRLFGDPEVAPSPLG